MKNWFSALSLLVTFLNLIIPAIPTPWDKLVAAITAILSFYFLRTAGKAIARKLKGGPKMKSFVWLILLIPILFMFGCASQTWQAKTTNSVIGLSYGLTVAKGAMAPPCEQNLIPADKCTDLKLKYKFAVATYLAAVKELEVALTTVDAVNQGNLINQLDVILAKFAAATTDLLNLFQEVQAAQTKTAVPAKIKELSPAVISIIIAALEALVKIAPDIISWISGWTTSPDIPALIAKLDAAVASIPKWE
jgi:hypothetical protein